MTLLLRNIQSIIKFNLKRLEKDVNVIRRIANVDTYDLGILCASNEYIQDLNATYRNKSKPTDILSFPFHEKSDYWTPGQLPKPRFDDDKNIGDLVIGMPYVFDRCKQEEKDLNGILAVLITHGICHLIGYEHETEEQFRLMYAKELDIINKFNKETGSNLAPMSDPPLHHEAES